MQRISRRARLAPRQKCGPPPPNAMCGFGERPTSNTCAVLEDRLVAVAAGVVHRDLLALLHLRRHRRPRRAAACGGSRSAVTPSAGTPRPPSSISAGSSISRCRCSGCSISASIAPEIRLRVVSLPATASRMKKPSKSASDMPVAVDLCAHQDADEIVARVRLAVLRHRVRVHEHLGRGDATVLRRRVVLRVVEADQPVAPVEHLLRDPPAARRSSRRSRPAAACAAISVTKSHEPFSSDVVDDALRDLAHVRLHLARHLRREAGARPASGTSCASAGPC